MWRLWQRQGWRDHCSERKSLLDEAEAAGLRERRNGWDMVVAGGEREGERERIGDGEGVLPTGGVGGEGDSAFKRQLDKYIVHCR